MKVQVPRKTLEKILNLIRPITTVADIRQITNSTLLDFSTNTLRVFAYGEEIFVDAAFPLDNKEMIAKILLDSKTLYNIATFNDSVYLTMSTSSSVEDLASGNGSIEIRGNSKYSLPVRNTISFPDKIDINSIEFSSMDSERFIDVLDTMSKFTDKNSIGFERGVFFSGKRAIATNHKHIFVQKELFPIANASFVPELSKTISGLKNIIIGKRESPRTILFVGEIEDENCNVVVGVSPIEDPCPVDRIFPIINGWLSSKRNKVEVIKDEVAKALARIKGISYDIFSFVDITVDSNEMTVSYIYNQYEVTSKIDCKSLPLNYESTESLRFSFKVYIRDLENILLLSNNEIVFSVLVDKPALIMEEEKRLLCLSLIG